MEYKRNTLKHINAHAYARIHSYKKHARTHTHTHTRTQAKSQSPTHTLRQHTALMDSAIMETTTTTNTGLVLLA